MISASKKKTERILKLFILKIKDFPQSIPRLLPFSVPLTKLRQLFPISFLSALTPRGIFNIITSSTVDENKDAENHGALGFLSCYEYRNKVR